MSDELERGKRLHEQMEKNLRAGGCMLCGHTVGPDSLLCDVCQSDDVKLPAINSSRYDFLSKSLDGSQDLSQTVNVQQNSNRSFALVNRAVELSATLGVAGGWSAAEAEFSHVAPGARRLAFKIYSRMVVK